MTWPCSMRWNALWHRSRPTPNTVSATAPFTTPRPSLAATGSGGSLASRAFRTSNRAGSSSRCWSPISLAEPPCSPAAPATTRWEALMSAYCGRRTTRWPSESRAGSPVCECLAPPPSTTASILASAAQAVTNSKRPSATASGSNTTSSSSGDSTSNFRWSPICRQAGSRRS